MKDTYEWTVKIAVAPELVADGFDLKDDDGATGMLVRAFPYAPMSGLDACVLVAPARARIRRAQGYSICGAPLLLTRDGLPSGAAECDRDPHTTGDHEATFTVASPPGPEHHVFADGAIQSSGVVRLGSKAFGDRGDLDVVPAPHPALFLLREVLEDVRGGKTTRPSLYGRAAAACRAAGLR